MRGDCFLIKILLFVAGLLSLALGVAGIFLPVLPTTPFMLLAAACFLKSSPKLYQWITTHPVFGRYIRLYLKYKGVTIRSKVISITMLWGVMGLSIYMVEILWLRILLICIGAGVTTHLLLMKTITQEMLDEDEESTLP